MESETQPKRTRGRPKKVVIETESSPESSTETTPVVTPETTPVKKTRGRPAKYAPEERQEKYKELCKNWQVNNKNYYVDANKKYLDRLKQSYKYLNMLIQNNRITFTDENEKSYVQKLFL